MRFVSAILRTEEWSMIKILFFIPRLSEGGAEKVLCNLVNNMDQSKFDITVQTVDYCNFKKYLAKGIHYKSIFHNNRSVTAKKITTLWYRFCTEFKLTYPLYIKSDYDIEIAFLECGATKVMAASNNKKALKLAWVHCDVKEKGLTARKSGKYYAKFDRVVCVSQKAKQSFDEVFGDYVQSTVLFNVIDETEIFQKVNEDIKITWKRGVVHLLTVGRLSYEKGYDRLLEICCKLKADGYVFQLHLIGDGPEKGELQKQAERGQITEYVDFQGYIANPYPYMEQADLIVIPSRTEALSTVAIESLILGKALITTRCAGMEELLGASEYGLIVENDTESLYHGLKKILDSPDEISFYESQTVKIADVLKKDSSVKHIQDYFMTLIQYIQGE